MSQLESLRDEFESFRDQTRRELREVRTLAEANDAELAGTRSNTRLIQALRETQLEQGRKLDEHSELLRQHDQHLALLSASYVGLEEDVAHLKSDVGTLKSDVGTLKSDVAGILRILDERLPPRP